MKPIFTLIFILIALHCKAQTYRHDMDLVMEVPALEAGRSLEKLEKRLNKIVGLRVEGFCPGMKLLCLRFDPEQYFNVLVSVNEAGYAYYIKKELKVNAAIDACSDKAGLYLRQSSVN